VSQRGIGASPDASGCYHAFGFSGHGFQLVPVVGAILIDLIVRGATRRLIDGLGAERLIKPRAATTIQATDLPTHHSVYSQE
jgi:sarcosine oxidase subunit beta